MTTKLITVEGVVEEFTKLHSPDSNLLYKDGGGLALTINQFQHIGGFLRTHLLAFGAQERQRGANEALNIAENTYDSLDENGMRTTFTGAIEAARSLSGSEGKD